LRLKIVSYDDQYTLYNIFKIETNIFQVSPENKVIKYLISQMIFFLGLLKLAFPTDDQFWFSVYKRICIVLRIPVAIDRSFWSFDPWVPWILQVPGACVSLWILLTQSKFRVSVCFLCFVCTMIDGVDYYVLVTGP